LSPPKRGGLKGGEYKWHPPGQWQEEKTTGGIPIEIKSFSEKADR